MSILRRRRPARGEIGLTVLELVVAVSLLVVVVPVAGSVMTGGTNQATRVQAASETLDELRGQLYALQHELRSASCIDLPAVVAPASSASGTTLRFTTQYGGSPYEVTYDIVGGELRRTVGANTTVVGNIVDGDFTSVATPRRRVDVRLVTQVDSRTRAREVETTVAARNGWAVAC